MYVSNTRQYKWIFNTDAESALYQTSDVVSSPVRNTIYSVVVQLGLYCGIRIMFRVGCQHFQYITVLIFRRYSLCPEDEYSMHAEVPTSPLE